MKPITELTIQRKINAPIDLVFKAWTDKNEAAKWWGPEGVTCPVCEIDPRVDGKIEIVMLAGEELGELKGSRWPMEGTIVDLQPPTKLVFTSSPMADGKPIMDGLNSLTLKDDDGKTYLELEIKITRTTPDAEGPLAGMEIGWNQSLDRLTKLVEASAI